MDITISNEVFGRIMQVMGYPIIPIAEMSNGLMQDDDIKRNQIWPAMQEYYRWFPKKLPKEYAVSTGNFEFDFPTIETFDIADSRYLSRLGENSGVTTNPFVNSYHFRNTYGGSLGMYGTVNDYDMTAARIMEMSELQGHISNRKTFKVRVDRVARKAYGYANITGRVLINWAEYSSNWGNIAFKQEPSVIKLAQANVLRFFGDLRNQANEQLPTETSGEPFLTKAERLEEEVYDYWKNFTKVVIVRG